MPITESLSRVNCHLASQEFPHILRNQKIYAEHASAQCDLNCLINSALNFYCGFEIYEFR